MRANRKDQTPQKGPEAPGTSEVAELDKATITDPNRAQLHELRTSVEELLMPLVEKLPSLLAEFSARTGDRGAAVREVLSAVEQAVRPIMEEDGVLVSCKEEPTTKTESSEAAISAQATIEALKKLREPEQIERFLERFVVGKTWGAAESNYLIASGITEHLRSLKLRVECPNDREPSVLRCYPATGMEAGSFTFEHYTEDREQQKRRMHRHVGKPIVPPLKIVPAPVDLRRKILGEDVDNDRGRKADK